MESVCAYSYFTHRRIHVHTVAERKRTVAFHREGDWAMSVRRRQEESVAQFVDLCVGVYVVVLCLCCTHG